MIGESIRYYWQYHKLIAIAVVAMMAVIAGSTVLGSSVRGTLVDRVRERLGSAETIVASGTGFMDESIADAPLFDDATTWLVSRGFARSNGRLIPVQVWATDGDSVGRGEARVNEPLMRKLREGADERSGWPTMVLHLPSNSLVPSGSLFVTKSYSTQMRLHVVGVKSVEDGGNVLLHNDQARPMNVFVNRQELGELMNVEGRINLIVSPRRIEEEQLSEVWTPEMSGLNVSRGKVTSSRIFLPSQVVEALRPERKVYAYLVNDIGGLPYSFVTAATSFGGKPLSKNEVLLSDYAAQRINARRGDTVAMEYFVAKGMKALETRRCSLRVKDIVPIAEVRSDSLLMADFPGLSNVERCADWDSDLPIDMSRIEKEDEDYWYAYGQTPKAIVAYDAVSADWNTPWGVATAVEIDSSVSVAGLIAPQAMGIVVSHPMEAGLSAAENSIDFGALFLALGFFIIVASILLMQNPMVEMLAQREDEIRLYATLGYSRARVGKLLCSEIGCTVIVASPIGILAGIAYSALTLFLLGNVWSGATHTEGFALHIDWLYLIVGWIVGLMICGITVAMRLRAAVAKQRKEQSTLRKRQGGLWIGIGGMGVFLVLYVYNLIAGHSILVFVACGLLWLMATGVLFMSFIDFSASKNILLNDEAVICKSLSYRRSQLLLSYWAMAAGVFTVFAVGLNRPDFSRGDENAALTGGYDLWCENSIPMQYDLNNEDVRRKLSLDGLPEDTRFMQCLRHTEDEAGCLNLNKVSTPTVLGVSLQDMKAFGISSVTPQASTSTLRSVFIDQESLTWSLMKSVGDTLTYTDSYGKPVQLLIAGTYPTGVFHGNALIDKEDFGEIWKDETGSTVMLIDTENAEEVCQLLEIALSEYGINLCTTADRLRLFFSVTDTYLAIFLTLGGLGLLLGVFCVVIIVRKNMLSRQQQIATMTALGFSAEKLSRMLLTENVLSPMFAIAMGAIGALISISANPAGAGVSRLLTAAFFLVVCLAIVFYGIRRITNNYIYKQH